MKFAEAHRASRPRGEGAPPLAPHERQEEGLKVQTYYHFREHIRNPPKLMAHFVHDTLTNESGYSEEVFTVAEADAVARFIASNEGEAGTVDPETGLPPGEGVNGTATATATEAGAETGADGVRGLCGPAGAARVPAGREVPVGRLLGS